MKEKIMKQKNKASILLEATAMIFIFLLILTIVSFKFQNIKEKNDMEEASLKISKVLDTYTLASLETKSRYKIKINYSSKEIKVEKINDIVEKLSLPKKLTYTTPYTIQNKLSLLDEISLETTENGNLAGRGTSGSLTIYILDYSDKVRYRIATYPYQTNKLIQINIYKKIKGEEVTKEEILDYHPRLYDEDEGVINDWRKEW